MRLSNNSFNPVTDANAISISIALRVTILFLFILCLLPAASARDYTLDGASTNITIDSSGIVHVEESISYTFEGQYNEVFRKLEVLPGQSIQNIKGHCSDET